MKTRRLPQFARSMLAARRGLRIRRALEKVTTRQNMKVIDIGCGQDGRSFEDFAPKNWQIVGVDMSREDRVRHTHPGFSYVRGNAEALAFADKSFDLAVSIGMLEHITEASAFDRVVSEIRRVAHQHIVIVPWRYALIEPHFMLPFFAVWPYGLQLRAAAATNSYHADRIAEDADYLKDNYCWPTNAEYRRHFPGSSVHVAPTLDTIAIIGRD